MSDPDIVRLEVSDHIAPGIDPGGAAAFLVAPAAGYVSGSIVAMDGGRATLAAPAEESPAWP